MATEVGSRLGEVVEVERQRKHEEPKEGTNPSDSVELSLSLKKSDKCYKEKLEALRKYELSG